MDLNVVPKYITRKERMIFLLIIITSFLSLFFGYGRRSETVPTERKETEDFCNVTEGKRGWWERYKERTYIQEKKGNVSQVGGSNDPSGSSLDPILLRQKTLNLSLPFLPFFFQFRSHFTVVKNLLICPLSVWQNHSWSWYKWKSHKKMRDERGEQSDTQNETIYCGSIT